MRRYSICLLLLVLCLGCNDADQRRQAEQAQRDATVNDLIQLGQAMHASQTGDSDLNSVAADAQDGATDSTGLPSNKTATPEQTDAAADADSTLPSTE